MVITNITEAFNPQDTIMKLSFFFQETLYFKSRISTSYWKLTSNLKEIIKFSSDGLLVKANYLGLMIENPSNERDSNIYYGLLKEKLLL